MSNQQYKNIGKKQIIKVVSQMIQKIEAIEMTLSLFIKLLENKGIIKDKELNDFITKELGGKNETSGDGEVDKGTDTPESNED